MGKLLNRIAVALAGVAVAIGVGVGINSKKAAPVQAAIDPNTEAVAFALTAKYNNNDNDGSSEITDAPNNFFTNGSTYLSAAECEKVYLGASSSQALKFGSSKAKGTLALTFKSGAQDTTYAPTKVIFSIAAANDASKKVNLSLNGASSGTGYSQITYGSTAKDFADYEVAWDGETNLTRIDIEAVNASNNRFYLKSISVVVRVGTHYNVSFNSLGGGSFDKIQVNENNAVGTLPTPNKPKDEVNQKRYVFLGWYALANTDDPENPTFEGATEYTASTLINADVTLFAKYQEINYYKVEFNSKGGSEVATQEIDAGAKAVEPTAPTKESDNTYSYAFAGWYKEEGYVNAYDFDSVVTANTTLFAKWNQTLRPAKEVVVTKDTLSSLAYSDYQKNVDSATDTLTRAFTGVAVSTSYSNWSDKVGASKVKYAGNSAGSNDTVQLRSSDNSGVIVTANEEGRVAKNISIKWHNTTQPGRTLYVYGKETAYTVTSELYNANTDGDLIAELCIDDSNDDNVLNYVFESDYKYIGIKSKTGAQYIDSIDIEWEEVTYTYTNLAVRFSGVVEQSLYERLNTESGIKGYGMLFAEYDFIKDTDADLKNWIILVDDENVKNYTNANTVHEPANKVTPTLKDGNYVWNLYKTIPLEKAKTDYVAVAYIILNNDELVFLKQVVASVKSLAKDLIDGPDRDENSFGGSLNYLASL